MNKLTSAVLEGSALEAPPGPAKEAALGWLTAMGLPDEEPRSSRILGGSLFSPEGNIGAIMVTRIPGPK